MEVTGTVHEIMDTVNVTDTFKRREIIIEIVENPTYPEFVKFEAIQDKTSLLDKCRKGDTVKVDFNLKGREWTSKEGKVSYFNTLQVWKLEKLAEGVKVEEAEFIPVATAKDDDLPF